MKIAIRLCARICEVTQSGPDSVVRVKKKSIWDNI